MTTPCPSCASPESARVIQTVRRANGARWRRHQCAECGHRWSTTEPDAFTPTPRRLTTVRAHWDARRVSSREAALIMLSDEPLRVLCARYGLTKRSVQRIKQGKSYRNIHQIITPLLQEAC